MHTMINDKYMCDVQLNAARQAAKASMESTGVPMIMNCISHILRCVLTAL